MEKEESNEIKKESNEMRVLRNFVEEFHPLYQGNTKGLTYDELFDIVDEIAKTHFTDKILNTY